jgi:predicted GIY-YIG superfamily endonuclease
MGYKSHWTLGKYGDVSRTQNGIESSSVTHDDAALEQSTVGNSPSWTYLLVSNKGEVYLGATTNLKKRLRSHNSPNNNGFTRGRRWHLLAARSFQTRKEAFDCENSFKKTGKKKWKVSCIPRATRIVLRFGYSFNPNDWDVS